MTDRLRILLLNYEFPPMGGGAGHASFQIARALVRQGCHVDVVTSAVNGQPAIEMVDGLEVYRVVTRRKGIQNCGFLGAWSYIAAAQPLCRRLLRERRHQIAHYFFSLPTGALRLITPEAKHIPTVVSLRGSDVPGYDPTNYLLQTAHTLLRPITRHIWKRADALVALSQSLREQARMTLTEKPIEVISNAIEHEIFTPARRNGHRGGTRLLTVARLIPRKGLTDLLQAMLFLHDLPIHLTIQGSGSDDGRLRELTEKLGLRDRITFSGFQPRHQLPSVYRQADIFVLPSFSESCGLVLLEAMACGLPAVVTRVGGMVEHIDDHVNGLVVPPRDPQALAAAIRRLAVNPELRTEMGARNALKVRMHYSWDRVASAYLSLYRNILELNLNIGAPHAHR